MGKNECQSFFPWNDSSPPDRILVIRLHAIGDVAITFPALHGFRALFPGAKIDYLTGSQAGGLAASLSIINNVSIFPQSLTRWERFKHANKIISELKHTRYNLMIDLQRNWVSRYIRRSLAPTAWGEFDRFGLTPAGEKTADVFHRAGFPDMIPQYSVKLKSGMLEHARALLIERGWKNGEKLVVLNPAGAWESRRWPSENYVGFGKELMKEQSVRFLLVGITRMNERASIIEKGLGDKVVNFVDQLSLEEAFGILQHASLMVSEDSGLMHMAWVSGIPTIALFGSTQHWWSTPLGNHSVCLHSGDLECGACMQPTCRFGDTHCLTRHTPEQVFALAKKMIP